MSNGTSDAGRRRLRLLTLRRLAAARRGSLAIIVALAFIPMIGAVGVAVDMTRAMVVKARLSQALDAAGLAVGAAPGTLTAAQVQTLARSFFDANYDGNQIGRTTGLSATVNGAFVDLTASAAVETTFLALFGIGEIDVRAAAQIAREVRNLEVALVLDNTGSMADDSKIVGLRNAAARLIDTMFGPVAVHDRLRMSLVPFVTAVNVRSAEFSAGWMDLNARARYHGVNFTLVSGLRANHLLMFNRMPGQAAEGNPLGTMPTAPAALPGGVAWNPALRSWKGCVENRAEPFDVQDAQPSAANPDTLFVPYLWPDDPDNATWSDPARTSHAQSQYTNNYLADGVTGSQRTRQANPAKYNGATPSILTGSMAGGQNTSQTTRGANRSCPQPMLPLTNVKAALLADIARMQPWGGSGTNIAAGLYWGWASLSPAPPLTTGAPYGDPETQKALILLTDGENVVSGGHSSHNESHYTGYGYLLPNTRPAPAGSANNVAPAGQWNTNPGRHGTIDQIAGAAWVDGRLTQLCVNIKAQNIRLYTIMFGLTSPTLETVFRNCATEPSLYFNSPTNAQLDAAFAAIANDLSNLRISR